MNKIFVTIYTKEEGKISLTDEDWHYKEYNLHREDGPAVEYDDGSSSWYLNGKIHREDGPALEYNNVYKAWYINGNLHRLDGPASIQTDGHTQWWIDGLQYCKKDFNELIKEVDSLDPALGLIDPRRWVRDYWKKKLKEVATDPSGEYADENQPLPGEMNADDLLVDYNITMDDINKILGEA